MQWVFLNLSICTMVTLARVIPLLNEMVPYYIILSQSLCKTFNDNIALRIFMLKSLEKKVVNISKYYWIEF